MPRSRSGLFFTIFAVSSTLIAQFMPVGFEELSMGASSSTVITERPKATPLSLGPEPWDVEEFENLQDVSVLVEISPSNSLSAVLYQFRESDLSGISFSYASGGGELLHRILKEHGTFDAVEASAEINLGMIRWNIGESVAYLSLPLDWSEDDDSLASYQIMSKEEAEDFIFFRAQEVKRKKPNQEKLAAFAAEIADVQCQIELDSSGSKTRLSSEIEACAEVIEEPAEVVAVEPVEELVEKSSNWWLWLIGAVVVVSGVVAVRRKKESKR